MSSPAEFLTPEECAEVDKALLTARDKFTARVAIYALRSLKQIAQQENTTIEALDPLQIETWVYNDSSLQGDRDREFRQFFSKLVIAATKPLEQAARSLQTDIATLTVPQVIAWFEAQAKQNLPS